MLLHGNKNARLWKSARLTVSLTRRDLEYKQAYLGFTRIVVLDYTSIQEALDALETEDGHRVLVEPGTCYEHVSVRKLVTFIGKNKKRARCLVHTQDINSNQQLVSECQPDWSFLGKNDTGS